MSVMRKYDYKFPSAPIIYLDETLSNLNLKDIVGRDSLLALHGNQRVKLSSSNTFSHGLRVTSLAEYITEWVDIDLANEFSSSFAAANESFYLFGNNYDGIFKEVNDQYVTPPCQFCDVAGAKTIGIGGKNSGVSFHFHAEGFSEPIIGRKQWFLFPAELTPLVSKFSPNMTVYQWTQQVFPKLLSLRNDALNSNISSVQVDASLNLLGSLLTGDENPGDNLFTETEWSMLANGLYHCIIEPGEVLFFPNHWMHATLNLDDYNVFYSLFIDVQLMK